MCVYWLFAAYGAAKTFAMLFVCCIGEETGKISSHSILVAEKALLVCFSVVPNCLNKTVAEQQK